MLVPILNVQSMTKEEFKKMVDEIDKAVSSPFVQSVEKKVGVHKFHMLGILIVLGAIVGMCINNVHADFITDLIGFVIPAFLSAKTVGDKKQHEQWVGYWVVFGFLDLLEYAIEAVLSVFPFYYTFKLVLILWLIAPKSNGGAVIYNTVLKPLLPKLESLGKKPKAEGDHAAPAAEGAHGPAKSDHGGGGKKDAHGDHGKKDAHGGHGKSEKKDDHGSKDGGHGHGDAHGKEGHGDAKAKDGGKDTRIKWGYVKLK
ncbi:TB2/DP1, HVA22 family-domain-containing protein [Fimicolochytrium jonesii]|uniref:TB2/DP1, HVA22 family-domain-containing protein n=1 Tax=Fimicolochytrium jonesii TaxID=1396493 RepID=UPI0022FEEE8A|nr:TB2/DP1, HVA22 family-domain-containing protein [Fimicolochytrium jonesii]KAI8821103.1 TB2/DP1, HVA22 family-domain-containing protein [Fimicolochytrium jonesii]